MNKDEGKVGKCFCCSKRTPLFKSPYKKDKGHFFCSTCLKMFDWLFEGGDE